VREPQGLQPHVPPPQLLFRAVIRWHGGYLLL
jgi:hypothetical protein